MTSCSAHQSTTRDPQACRSPVAHSLARSTQGLRFVCPVNVWNHFGTVNSSFSTGAQSPSTHRSTSQLSTWCWVPSSAPSTRSWPSCLPDSMLWRVTPWWVVPYGYRAHPTEICWLPQPWKSQRHLYRYCHFPSPDCISAVQHCALVRAHGQAPPPSPQDPQDPSGSRA